MVAYPGCADFGELSRVARPLGFGVKRLRRWPPNSGPPHSPLPPPPSPLLPTPPPPTRLPPSSDPPPPRLFNRQAFRVAYILRPGEVVIYEFGRIAQIGLQPPRHLSHPRHV